MTDVLVIAFDGLDKDLIENFNLSNIKQEEYGTLDNSEDVAEIKTSELFASFITGETNSEHGIKGLSDYNIAKESISNLIFPNFALSNIRGFHRARRSFELLIGHKKRNYDKRDLNCEPIFEKINNSRALFVPAYNPSHFWKYSGPSFGLHLKEFEVEERELGFYWDDFEYERRKRKLFRPVNKWYDFLMCHFHRPDVYHHLYADENLSDTNMDKIEQMYGETDELAQEIIEFFEEDYDYIIFMSDHGLPTETEHNENAFYSCNKELFGDETPHITDFHDKILELTGNEDKIESK